MNGGVPGWAAAGRRLWRAGRTAVELRESVTDGAVHELHSRRALVVTVRASVQGLVKVAY